MGKNKGRGTPPSPNQPTLREPKHDEAGGYPLLSLRHLRSGYGVEDLTVEQRAAFLTKWAKRSQFSWKDLGLHPKHGLGYEQLPSRQIKRDAPEHLTQDKYMVMRHEGNHSFVGFKAGDTFYALWIEAAFGDVYDH